MPLGIFLSTLSLRRATHKLCVTVFLFIFLSTLSLRRATFGPRDGQGMGLDFYPRSPCGERPLGILGGRLWHGISIHALLAESDRWVRSRRRRSSDFYPRSPCGERPPRLSRVVPTPIFLSTLSLRRATSLILTTI